MTQRLLLFLNDARPTRVDAAARSPVLSPPQAAPAAASGPPADCVSCGGRLEADTSCPRCGLIHSPCHLCGVYGAHLEGCDDGPQKASTTCRPTHDDSRSRATR